MQRTYLIRRHVFDVIVLESVEENDDFADVAFELAHVATYSRDLSDRLTQCAHRRVLKS